MNAAALKPEDTRDALRKVGLILFGIGALMLFFRKGDSWGDFPVFLVLAIPAAILYGAGVLTEKDTGGLQPWQAVSSVFGLIFVPLALFQFIEMIGGSPSALNTFWIFGVTAGLAFYAGHVVGVRFGLLAGGLAVIVSWSAIWDKILGDEGIAGHVGAYRGLLGLLAIGLVAGGVYLWRTDKENGLVKFSELLTAAGISALIGCALGITAAAGQVGSFIDFPIVETSTFWDVALLILSVGLIAIGAQIGLRGPVYVGAIGLFLFLFIVGADLNEGADADPSKLGLWPLILLLGGGGAVAASLSESVSLGDKPKELVQKISEG